MGLPTSSNCFLIFGRGDHGLLLSFTSTINGREGGEGGKGGRCPTCHLLPCLKLGCSGGLPFVHEKGKRGWGLCAKVSGIGRFFAGDDNNEL